MWKRTATTTIRADQLMRGKIVDGDEFAFGWDTAITLTKKPWLQRDVDFTPTMAAFKLQTCGGWMMHDQELPPAIGAAAAHELTSALERIRHCVSQLTDEQLWHRTDPSFNSIGNLILHLCGNLQQWIVAGIGGVPDNRNRPAEFAERGPIPGVELMYRLGEVVEKASRVLKSVTASQLLEFRRIQGWEISGLTAIFDSVPHFRGHTQEIVALTRQMLGKKYRFAWTPTTVEQGAPSA